MARFRRSGTNWEPRSWKTSPALNALMDEVEAKWPLRGPGDGTVASETHDKVSPFSDHRPYPYIGEGVVNAVDVGEYVEGQGIEFAEALRRSGDKRLRYVIHEGRAFYTYYRNDGYMPWAWRPYGGTSPHENHVHASVDRSYQQDGSPWNLGLITPTPDPGDEMVRPTEWTDADWVAFRDRAGWAFPAASKPGSVSLQLTRIENNTDTVEGTLGRIEAAIAALEVGDGLTAAEVAAIVRAEIDKTRLGLA